MVDVIAKEDEIINIDKGSHKSGWCFEDGERMIKFECWKPIPNKASLNFLYQLRDACHNPYKDFWSL